MTECTLEEITRLSLPLTFCRRFHSLCHETWHKDIQLFTCWEMESSPLPEVRLLAVKTLTVQEIFFLTIKILPV